MDELWGAEAGKMVVIKNESLDQVIRHSGLKPG